MLIPIAAALVLSLAVQTSPMDREAAAQLARTGRSAEALAIFERIVAANPADLDARASLARLQLRVGRVSEAEAGFRAVLLVHPADVDSRIGLGATLTRRDAWTEALTVLHSAERDAGNNAELFTALGRAYRRSGDDRRALSYFERAKAIAPEDQDIVDAYEATLRAYGSSLLVEGFAEGGVSDARSVLILPSVRVTPKMELEGRVRLQEKNHVPETLFGAGGVWRFDRVTNLAIRGAGGAGNLSLPKADVMAEMRTYRGALEISGIVRHLAFNDVGVTAGSPVLAWDTGSRWRHAARYTFSWSAFHASGQTSGDHSFLIRETFRSGRRVDMSATYAYGIENFEDLTADRISNLGAHTLAGTLQVRLPSLLSVAATWERQLRSNDTRIDRLTVTMVQGFKK